MAAALGMPGAAGTALADVGLVERFETGLGGNLIALAHDPDNGRLYLYRNFQPVIDVLDASGALVDTLPRPGASSIEFDLDVAPEALDIAGTVVPAGTLLVINGDDTPNTVYALDPADGTVLASQTIPGTGFGGPFTAVGGGWHPGRDTFFAADYRGDAIFEVDLAAGVVVGSFVAGGGFDTFYGDLDVSPQSGNLLVVSDRQPRIRELTPEGAWVRDIDIAAFVGTGSYGMSGIAVDGASGEARVAIRWGEVVHLSGVVEALPPNGPPLCVIAELPAADCSTLAGGDGADGGGIVVDGSGSQDPDPGDVLTFAWSTSCPQAWFDDPAAAAPALQFAMDGAPPCALDCEVQLTVSDLAGAASTCSAAIAVADVTPPTLVLETRELFVLDRYCDGDVDMEMPRVEAADDCDPQPAIESDADVLVMSPGETAMVTYIAVDACGNATAGGPEHQLAVTLVPGAGIEVRASLQVFDNGESVGPPRPLAGMTVAAFDRSRGSCAREQGHGVGPTAHDYPAIIEHCQHEAAASAVTDEDGRADLAVPPGRYVVAGRAVIDGKPYTVGAKVGRLRCGQYKHERLRLKVEHWSKDEADGDGGGDGGGDDDGHAGDVGAVDDDAPDVHGNPGDRASGDGNGNGDGGGGGHVGSGGAGGGRGNAHGHGHAAGKEPGRQAKAHRAGRHR